VRSYASSQPNVRVTNCVSKRQDDLNTYGLQLLHITESSEEYFVVI